MIKRWIIKLFKIKTYEEEYHKFKKLYEVTLDELNMTRTVAESYRANLEDIKQYENGRETYNMCKAFDDHKESGR